MSYKKKEDVGFVYLWFLKLFVIVDSKVESTKQFDGIPMLVDRLTIWVRFKMVKVLLIITILKICFYCPESIHVYNKCWYLT